MQTFFKTFEHNIATMDIMDMGHRIVEGLRNDTSYLFLRQLTRQTNFQATEILLAGAPCSANPEYVARFYRRLLSQTYNQSTSETAQATLAPKLNLTIRTHTIDREETAIQNCRQATQERTQFLKEKAGLEFKYSQGDLGKKDTLTLQDESIDIAFMDCLLALNPNTWKLILTNLGKIIGPTGVIFFREMLAQNPLFQRLTKEGLKTNCPELETDYTCLYKRILEQGAIEAGLTIHYLPVTKPLGFSISTEPHSHTKVIERLGMMVRQ